ncbi:FliM/FliN family flagellar motor switch protein [Marimonas lutisalis]|uniref:FliM/FliN family flagellar motor switch protein n=1 Tax=Marimonas lutisalis TaxID=2545756 RepID=UPI001375C610|nr:FliM/FliN family flagellar motor C-terminal domain-containing protein [Marimonas lutisalis]
MSPARAMRLALSRAAEDLFELALTVSGVQIIRAGQDAVLSSFDDTQLLMVLDGPDGALGAAAMDVQMLAGLIEMQTMGQVLPRPADPRAATQTDAAMAAPLLDAALAGLRENLEGQAAALWAEGFRFGARIESARMLGLLLEAPDFHLFRLALDIGPGAKQGEMVLALPVRPHAQENASAQTPGTEQADKGTHAGALQLGQGALMVAEAPLEAVLCRLRMSLSELGKLTPGEVLSIPRDALAKTRLEAGRDRPLGECRLGQINGFRAVRLTTPAPDPSAKESAAPDAPQVLPDEAMPDAKGQRIGGVAAGENSNAPGLPAPMAAAVAADPDTADTPREMGPMEELTNLGDLSDLPELSLGDGDAV